MKKIGLLIVSLFIATTGRTQVTQAEYFIDVDPGVGQGISIPSILTGRYNPLDLPVAGLSPGIHTLQIRARTSEGIWSHYASRIFEVKSANVPPLYTQAEYFIDVDPGVGQGTTITLSQGGTLDEELDIPIDGLAPGIHTLQVRTQSDEGIWSHYLKKTFSVSDRKPALARTEYYIGSSDPGWGSGIPVSLLEIQDTLEILIEDFPIGEDTLFVRARDVSDVWGFTRPAPFEVINPTDRVAFLDSMALVALYQRTGGPNWISAQNWLVTPIVDWEGISLNSVGNEVLSIALPANNLTDTLPAELENLSALQRLILGDNNLTEIEADLTSIASLVATDVSANRLDFGDLEPMIALAGLQYQDQKPFTLNQEGTISVTGGVSFTLESSVGGTANTYQWYFEEAPATGETAALFSTPSIGRDHIGSYRLAVQNNLVPDLTLHSNSVEVRVTARVTVSIFEENGAEYDLPLHAHLISLNETTADTVTFDEPLFNLTSPFELPPVEVGKYYLVVEPELGVLDPEAEYVPTYLGEAFQSGKSDTLTLLGDESLRIDLHPMPQNVLTGSGSVCGSVDEYFPEEVMGQPDDKWSAKHRKCGLTRKTGSNNALSNNDFELIAYSQTDDKGAFEFDSLPGGTYRFFIEYPGIPMDEAAFVEFDIGEGGSADDSFVLNVFAQPQAIQVSLVLSSISASFSGFTVYPNPMQDVVYLYYGMNRPVGSSLQIISSEGILQYSTPLSAEGKQEALDVSELSQGMYLLQVLSSQGKPLATRRVIKE